VHCVALGVHVQAPATQLGVLPPHTAHVPPGLPHDWGELVISVHVPMRQHALLHASPPAQLVEQVPAILSHACPEGQSLALAHPHVPFRQEAVPHELQPIAAVPQNALDSSVWHVPSAAQQPSLHVNGLQGEALSLVASLAASGALDPDPELAELLSELLELLVELLEPLPELTSLDPEPERLPLADPFPASCFPPPLASLREVPSGAAPSDPPGPSSYDVRRAPQPSDPTPLESKRTKPIRARLIATSLEPTSARRPEPIHAIPSRAAAVPARRIKTSPSRRRSRSRGTAAP